MKSLSKYTSESLEYVYEVFNIASKKFKKINKKMRISKLLSKCDHQFEISIDFGGKGVLFSKDVLIKHIHNT